VINKIRGTNFGWKRRKEELGGEGELLLILLMKLRLRDDWFAGKGVNIKCLE